MSRYKGGLLLKIGPALQDQLFEFHRASGRSVSEIARAAVAEYLSRHDPSELAASSPHSRGSRLLEKAGDRAQ